MTGKELPCLGIAGHRGVPHVDHGVLDVGVPQPVLHEGHIGSGVQQMHRNRVAQRMKTPLGFRQWPARSPYFCIKSQYDRRSKGMPRLEIKSVRGVVLAGPQVGPDAAAGPPVASDTFWRSSL